MPKLYVANFTQQIQVFIYRVIESSRPFQLEIPIGGQVNVPGDKGQELTSKDIDYIIEQHSKYEMIKADEIDRTRRFAGTCYSVDKFVPAAKIEKGVQLNRGVLVERGAEIQKLAAVGISNKIDQEMPGLKGLELTAVELDNPRKGTTGEFSTATRVDKTVTPTKPGRGKRKAA